MNDTIKRVIGYGAFALITSGLVYGGFVHKSEADLDTMCGSIEIQLQMASAMPAADKDGNPVPGRQSLIDSVVADLDKIELIDPDYVPAQEYRAYVAFLESRFLESAAAYEDLRGAEGCSAEMRDQSIINQSRMLRMAGCRDDARALLAASRTVVSQDYREPLLQELAAMDDYAAKNGAVDSSNPAASPN